ncbi:hypothetical protein [Blastococcus deserti]|uniref:PknH-like protein n=1 Tax=Blastococcus deserti TaxID=2259033 RepID=A0ABW4X9C7_9ACTN
MTSGRRPRPVRGAVLLAVVAGLLSLTGCTRAVAGTPTAGAVGPLPGSAEELEPLIVTDVPSGRARLPDDEVHPPAGAKRAEDVAGYAADPAREREVLEDYGYRYGWERFWGDGPTSMTGVFVDQFDARAGAGAYAEDLARNDAEHYDGELDEHPPDLPGGCRLLTVEEPRPAAALMGPAALAWCGHGVFSVGVTAVGPTVDAAEAEVRAVLAEQLDRLPPR